jgi:hypothetical protein
MALTPPGDLYVGISDTIFKKALTAIQTQRPSLLNYMTPYFVANPNYWCSDIPQPANGGPKYTSESPIQTLDGYTIPGVEYIVQIADIEAGFGVDTVGLPPELLPLPPQRIVAKVSVNVRLAVPKLDPTSLGCPGSTPTYQPHVCDCFNATLFATMTSSIMMCSNVAWILFAFDQIDSTNVTPPGLRDTVNYFAVLVLDTIVLPTLWVALKPYPIDLTKALPATAPIKTITLTPIAPTALPNPDIANDLLQARIQLKVTTP